MALRLVKIACGMVVSLAFTAVCAQDYPNRPAKIVVGYAAGGGLDIIARAVAQRVGTSLGQTFIVENRAGAGGTLATAQVAKAPADGYTLLLGETGQLAIAPYMFKALGYDSARDFSPVARMVTGPLILVSSRKSAPQIKTLNDFIREAKAQPGKFDFASSGIGSIHHLAMEALIADLGLSVTHVPFRGAALTLPAIMAGEVHVGYISFATLGQNASQVNVLAVSSKDRFPLLPDVPAISELIKGYDFTSQQGILAPAGTPADVVTKLSNAIKTAVQSPDLVDRFKTLGVTSAWTTPEGYAEIIRNELTSYERAVKLAKIKPE